MNPVFISTQVTEANNHTMAFQLRQATQDVVEAMCDGLSAFKHEIFSRQAFPRTSDTGRAYWRHTFSEELEESSATFLVAIDPSSPSPVTVVGFVKWVAPGAPTHDFSDDGYPADGLPETAALYYEKLFAGHRRTMGATPHWYLDMIGVRQGDIGRGAARQLVDWGLERAKADGEPCFVESTGDARGFTKGLAFERLTG